MPHAAKTLFADRVVYVRGECKHVAFVTKTFDDDPHKANLVAYCPEGHIWFEADEVMFGATAEDGSNRMCYFVNPEDC